MEPWCRHLLPETISWCRLVRFPDRHRQFVLSAVGQRLAVLQKVSAATTCVTTVTGRPAALFSGQTAFHWTGPQRVSPLMDVKQQLSSASGCSTHCHHSAAVMFHQDPYLNSALVPGSMFNKAVRVLSLHSRPCESHLGVCAGVRSSLDQRCDECDFLFDSGAPHAVTVSSNMASIYQFFTI